MANRSTETGSDLDISDQVAALKSDLTALKNDLTGMAQAMMKQGKASAYAAKDDVERRLHDGMEQGRKYVEERPLTAALAAFGIGLIAGFGRSPGNRMGVLAASGSAAGIADISASVYGCRGA